MIFPAFETSIYGWNFPWRTVSHNQMVNVRLQVTAIVCILQQFLDEMHRRRVELLSQLPQTAAERAPQHTHVVATRRNPGWQFFEGI
jgi:ACT domain-containing protein